MKASSSQPLTGAFVALPDGEADDEEEDEGDALAVGVPDRLPLLLPVALAETEDEPVDDLVLAALPEEWTTLGSGLVVGVADTDTLPDGEDEEDAVAEGVKDADGVAVVVSVGDELVDTVTVAL